MSLDDPTRQRIDSLIESNPVLLFMKGTREAPQCGFSATCVGILDKLLPDYATLDVLADGSIREGIKAYSSWPTIPQLYVRGEFIGGCDILQELFASGELQQKLGVEGGAVSTPSIRITDEAAAELRQAIERDGGEGRELHLGIDARFNSTLSLAPRAASDVEVEAQGVRVLLDPMSAGRADGATIDVVETPRGRGFQVDNPNAPRVFQLSVEELKKWLDAGEAIELLDVRTPGERAQASIPGSVLLTDEEAQRLASRPRDTRLVFHCHHGGRAQAAAERFAAMGFERVYNVEGGIDAWSARIDPDVPRY